MKSRLLNLGLGLIMFGLVASSAFSQTVISSNIGATNRMLIGRYGISSVSVSATSATTVLFYDTTNLLLIYTNPTYRVLTNTNAVNFEVVFNNSLGNLSTSYYNGPYYYWVTNGATSNAMPAFASISVEANTPISIPTTWFVGQGLTLRVVPGTGTGLATVTLLYK